VLYYLRLWRFQRIHLRAKRRTETIVCREARLDQYPSTHVRGAGTGAKPIDVHHPGWYGAFGIRDCPFEGIVVPRLIPRLSQEILDLRESILAIAIISVHVKRYARTWAVMDVHLRLRAQVPGPVPLEILIHRGTSAHRRAVRKSCSQADTNLRAFLLRRIVRHQRHTDRRRPRRQHRIIDLQCVDLK